MSSARRRSEDDAAARERVASGLASAGYVRLLAAPGGDAVAAAAVLAGGLEHTATPFHVRTLADPLSGAGDDIDPDAADADADVAGDDPAFDDVRDDEFTLVVAGAVAADAVVAAHPTADATLPAADGPASATAFAVARELGVEPDPVLALAGAVAAGSTPGADGTGPLLEAARQRDLVERRPGLAIPTDDVAADLAATTLLCAPYSGDPTATSAAVSDLGVAAEPDEDDRRRLAAAVAVDVVGDDDGGRRAAEAVERALRPYATPSSPLATVGGYADVLRALAPVEPGLAVSLALHDHGCEAAVEHWRAHGHAAHGVVRDADVSRHAGLTVHDARDVALDGAEPGETAAALRTAARLCRDFRSPEPVAAVRGEVDGTALVAVAGGGDVGDTRSDAGDSRSEADDPDTPTVADAVAAAADAVDGAGGGTDSSGWARLDAETTDVERFMTALREGLR